MSYCPSCGVENPAASRFCDQCGAALVPVPSSVPVAAPLPIARPVQPAAPPPRAAVVPTGLGSVTCSQCGASAIPGEAFCDNCGAPLSAPAPATSPVYATGLAPQPTYPAPQPVSPAPQPIAPPVSSAPQPVPRAPLPTVAAVRAMLAPARLVFDTGDVITLPNTAQAVIGRADAVSNYAPDIDLTNHGALGGGVGRRHARLLLQQGHIAIEDLDSTNGTLLNTVRLQPRQPQALQDGDTVQLGSVRMRFQI